MWSLDDQSLKIKNLNPSPFQMSRNNYSRIWHLNSRQKRTIELLVAFRMAIQQFKLLTLQQIISVCSSYEEIATYLKKCSFLTSVRGQSNK